MQPTADKQRLETLTRASFSNEIDPLALTSKNGGYVLEGKGGFMLFVLSDPQTYKVTVGFEPASRDAANTIAAMREGYAWLFANTDAETVIGYIDPSNKGLLALAPQIPEFAIERKADVIVVTLTRKRWEARKQ